MIAQCMVVNLQVTCKFSTETRNGVNCHENVVMIHITIKLTKWSYNKVIKPMAE